MDQNTPQEDKSLSADEATSTFRKSNSASPSRQSGKLFMLNEYRHEFVRADGPSPLPF